VIYEDKKRIMGIRLTDISIRQLPFVKTGQKKIRDDYLPGFGMIIGKASKTFFVMYGKERRTKTLGKWPSVLLKDARQTAKKMLANPATTPRSVSLSDAREAFLDDCANRLRQSTTDRYFYALKDLPSTSLDKVSLDTTDATQLKSLKVFYNWCIDHGLTDTNPFVRRKVIFNQRDRVLSDDEVVAIWNHEHKPYSDVVKMLILTGQRRAQFADFKLDWITEGNIVFPAHVMKSGKQHIIPFLPEWEQQLPSASSNSWSRNKTRMDKDTDVTDYVLHDFRRYFSTTCAKIGIPLHITELILDHRTQISGVAAIYNRYNYLEEMKEACTQYEGHIRSLGLGETFQINCT